MAHQDIGAELQAHHGVAVPLFDGHLEDVRVHDVVSGGEDVNDPE